MTRKSDAEVITILNLLADQFKYYGYNYFTQDFIDKLQKELAKLVEEANNDHDSDKIKPFRIEKIIRRKSLIIIQH